jgi:hypothetical protein
VVALPPLCFDKSCIRQAKQNMSDEGALFRRVSSTSPPLVESYCRSCGLLIAASPALNVIEIMEALHHCQGPSKELSRGRVDRVLRELAAKEADLRNWIELSERNTRWFASDPMSAIRAANLGIDEHILRDLEMITASIARKLRGAE